MLDHIEDRLAELTALVATAISNSASRAELAQLADEQAALRRVATLVARESPREEIFAAVADELGRLLGVDAAALIHYEADGSARAAAAWAEPDAPLVKGPRRGLEGESVVSVVRRTRRPARTDDDATASGSRATQTRARGFRSTVGFPVVVGDRLWGALVVGSLRAEPMPAGTESRIGEFTELVATAIANIQARSELAASRARIIVAADEARRRIERDLHDGSQQQLVSLMLELRTAQATEPSQVDELRTQLARTEQRLADVLEELREISQGIHPAILSKGGLTRALRALAGRSSVPVELDLHAEWRPPEAIEVAMYYVVSEALANVAKHAHASLVNVKLDARKPVLHLTIRDDGIGGADLTQGSGLVGLRDRVDALGGRLQLSSPVGTGTTLFIQIPIER